MSDERPHPSDAVAGYVDLAKWIVGLCAAVIAGVFLHPEHISQRAWPARGFMAVVLFLFGASIISGVLYPFWLNWTRRQGEKLAEVDEQLAQPLAMPDPERRKKLLERKKKLEDGQLNVGPGWTNFWYKTFVYSFCLAALLGILGFCASIVFAQKKADVLPPPPPAPPAVPLHFTMTQSAVHHTKHGMQAHTFLLNQQTGEVWQMVCDSQGNVVAFQKVVRRGVDGKPE